MDIFNSIVFDDLQPLIKLDPLLLPQLVSICPTEELPSFIELIPTYLSAAWLSHWLEKSRDLNNEEVKLKDKYVLHLELEFKSVAKLSVAACA